MLFERALRPGLFRIGGGDPEAAHGWTLRRLAVLAKRPAALAMLRRRYAVTAPCTAFGLEFPNPVGLAAGMDKDGVALPSWPALGFGFVEVGSVTWHPQPGNNRPRLYRLPASEAVINRMGFNNRGARVLADRLATLTATVGRLPAPLGISLGKSKATDLAVAVEDYLASYRVLREHGDYFAVNVSSPNTPGLRRLQDRDHLDALLAALVGEKPILVKIAPDLTEHAIGEVLQVCTDRGAAGIIATNTTLGRDGLDPADRGLAREAGGLSGRPLAARAREVVAFVHRQTGGALPVIGVGGLMTPDDAVRMREAGASLVQLYTGFIYHGPALVRATARRLAGERARSPGR
jgi:dihydroorotate dehydrogenase